MIRYPCKNYFDICYASFSVFSVPVVMYKYPKLMFLIRNSVLYEYEKIIGILIFLLIQMSMACLMTIVSTEHTCT